MRQPFEPPAPPQLWAGLQKVLVLAALGNVAIKISGACTLSHLFDSDRAALMGETLTRVYNWSPSKA